MRKLLRLYYSIWADAILKYRDQNPSFSDRVVVAHLLLFISGFESMVIPIYVAWKKIIDHNIHIIYNQHYAPLPERFTIGAIHIVLFLFPLMFFNYLLIIRKKRYLRLVEKYSTPKQNYGHFFYISGLLSVIITAIIYSFFF